MAEGDGGSGDPTSRWGDYQMGWRRRRGEDESTKSESAREAWKRRERERERKEASAVVGRDVYKTRWRIGRAYVKVSRLDFFHCRFVFAAVADGNSSDRMLGRLTGVGRPLGH
jgi:hypothetical protein